MKKILQALFRLNGNSPKEKNIADVLNVIAARPSQERARFGQRALPRFLRRSDRSGLRNPNR